MPNATQRKLTELMREGLDVYPSSLRGLAAPRKGAMRRAKPADVVKFVEWVKLAHPRLYADSLKKSGVVKGSFGLGQVDEKAESKATAASPLDRIVSTITQLAPTYLQYRAQREIFDAQMQRLSQGLPPIADPSAYAPSMRFALDPATVDYAAERAQPWLLWGGLALGAFFLFSMMNRRR